VLEVSIACALALVAEVVTARGLHGRIVAGGAWYAVIRRDVPPGTYRIWLWVTADDGTQFKVRCAPTHLAMMPTFARLPLVGRRC
jgi:hypothetical protein